uniref:Pentacotripeptide-repeat region of PRORP domain-containing protein n=1 Tax=Leersia perrieri TaxID=77586 RepID=A0A0D9XS39_9ORYZ
MAAAAAAGNHGGGVVRRRPNLSLLADRCATLRALAAVHAAMLVSGRLADDAFAASRLLAAYASLSPSPSPSTILLRLLASLPYVPNSFMLNTTLRALASSPSSALRFFSLLRRRRNSPFTPGRHTFPFLLKATSHLPIRATEQLHALAVRHGLDCDAHVGNGLVRAYSVAGLVGVARKVFDGMPERSGVVYTSMVSAYAQNGMYEDAMVVFEEMVGVEGLELRGAAVASVLSACARSGGSRGLEMGRRVHGMMEERGMTAPVGVILGTALVDMYAKTGAMEEAMEVFDGMPERCTATWNALITGLARHGHGEGALSTFHRMRREGVPPNATTLVGVLSAYCCTGRLDEARHVFASMEKEFGVAPTIQHYGCMVDLLGRSGLLIEAEEMIRGMTTCDADTVIWGALLTACKNHGDIDVAERAVQEMLKLDPDNHGVYVVLSNMYAEAGRWQDVDKLRKVMKQARLSKIPGSSEVAGDG